MSALTPEPEVKLSAEQIARITRLALSQLAETHVIMSKDEFRDLLDDTMDKHTTQIWDLVLSSYRDTTANLAEVLPPAQLKGFELGGKLLERLHGIIREEHPGVPAPADN